MGTNASGRSLAKDVPATPRVGRPWPAALGWALLTAWLVFGLYLGMGSWTRLDVLEAVEGKIGTGRADEPVVEANGIKARQSVFEAMQLQAEAERLFPFHFAVPSLISYLLGAFGFGALGSIMSILRDCVSDAASIQRSRIGAAPLLGALVAIFVVASAYLVPIALTRARDPQIRTVALLLLSMFAGFKAELFLDWAVGRISTNALRSETKRGGGQ